MNNTHPSHLFMNSSSSTAAGLVGLVGLVGPLLFGGCGPSFDPASLIQSTRVVGARVEIAGEPGRATPRPSESTSVTWLVTAPEGLPPLSWAYALCAPGTVDGKSALGCESPPQSLFQGTSNPPRISFTVPSAEALGSASSLVLYGQLCAGAGSTPTFDPDQGIPSCAGNGEGTTASAAIRLQRGAEANHNPTAERAFALDGQSWAAPAAAGADPCMGGPRVAAGSKGHVIATTTAGADREPYTALVGDPPVATPTRETLQVSHFTTAGELKSQFAFVEAADPAAETTVEVKWDAPKSTEVPAAGLPVTFTFVVRDDRGGIDWTTRAACVAP